MSLHLCSNGHDEVVYEYRNCPVCKLQTHLEEENTKTDLLRDELTALTTELEEIKREMK